MPSPGKLENLNVADIEFDRNNPRIRRFLEMYEDTPTPEQIYLALGAGGDEDSAGGVTFEKLKNSILTSRGIIQPIIVNRLSDGRLICVEGNTRVAIYRSFVDEGIAGNWARIQSIVHEQLHDTEIEAIRLQAHLVGPRPWDPYSKAKYLHHLRTRELLPLAQIVDFCGGRQKDVLESINAYQDMERYYRPILPDDTSFDATRFSGFVELQKTGIKDALRRSNHTLEEFAHWIHHGKLYPLATVRSLPRILKDAEAHQIFLKQDAQRAIKVLDKPDLEKTLQDANLGQLARGLIRAIAELPWAEVQRLRTNDTGETLGHLSELQDALGTLMDSLSGNQ